MTINTRLSELLDYMLEIQLAVDEQLPDAERDRTGTFDDWSIKDNLAHNAEWANRHRAELEAVERGQPWPAEDLDDDEEDQENLLIFEMHRDKSWNEVRAMLRDAYAGTQTYLDRVSEDTLLMPIPVNPDRPSWRFLAGNHVLHPMIHIWEYLKLNDHAELVPELFGESFAERLLAVSDDRHWHGTTLYNLACIYALAGKKAQAIEQLGRALAMEPSLTEWSQQDSDLESLRGEPAFQALYEG
jgi:hypothetical protein